MPSFRSSIITIISTLVLLLLASCGGGGTTGTDNPKVDTTIPIFSADSITLTISTKPDEITVAWLAASDDTSPASDITYEIYADTNESFTPSTSTLVASFTGENTGVISGLLGNTTYYLKAIAVDASNNKSSTSNPALVKTAIAEAVVKTSAYRDSTTISTLPPVIDGTQYTFTADADSQTPAVDEVIVGEDSDGSYYLRKVDNVTQSNAEIKVETSDADLSEIISEGVISTNFILSEPSISNKTSNRNIAYRSSIQNGNVITENVWKNKVLKITQTDFSTVFNRSQKYINGYSNTRNKSANKTTYQTSTNGGELTLTSGISFEPSIVSYAEFSLAGLDRAEVYAEGDFDLNATLGYSFNAAANVSQTKQIFKRTYSSVYNVGPVPVQQDITFTLDAEFTASAQTEITAEAVSELLANVKFGVRYLNGAWSLIGDKNLTKTMTISATVQGIVTAEVRLIPNLEVKFYKVAASGLSVEPYITGTAAAEIVSNTDLLNQASFNNYRFTRLDASLGLDANVYAEFKIFKKTLARYPSLDPNEKKTIFSLEYPLFSLPELSLSGNGVPYINSNSFTLLAEAVDGVNNEFDSGSIQWVAYPSGKITVNANNPYEATFTPDQTGIDYTLYFIGNGSSLGTIGRQFQSITVSFQDDDNDGIPNAWEIAYGFDPSNYNDALSDLDGDGLTNLEEYQNNTDPTVFNLGGSTVVASRPLNDTGITWGGNYPSGNNATCIGETIAEQDCSHGRDAQTAAGTLSKVGAGHAGFDFSKLDANGHALADQTQDYATQPWSCVKDNHTGLVWEVKAPAGSGGIHDANNRYRWGGKTALLTGIFGTVYDDWDSLVDGSNNEVLCGFSDWRVPELDALNSIVNYDQFSPPIDTQYFPNTLSTGYWSASPNADSSDIAWHVNFGSGGYYFNLRGNTISLRLVRGGQ